MSSDVFVIYQIDNSEKNREYRCRSYEYQIQHGFMITADNYGTGYSGTATRGMGAEAIRKKMESINPDKFKIRKFGVSDVIGLTAEGKTSFFYHYNNLWLPLRFHQTESAQAIPARLPP